MIHVYAGPSLAENRASLPGPFCIHPPAAAGDLLDCAVPGDRVVLIDGYLANRRSVRHKEILSLIGSGVDVWGAASIGALRAAELAVHGMKGVGCVFSWYRHGLLDGDDEVAVLHSADGRYEQLTIAMVDLRATIHRLLAEKRLTVREARRLLTRCATLAFSERTPDAVFAELPDVLREEVEKNWVGVKSQDARHCVELASRTPLSAKWCGHDTRPTALQWYWERSARPGSRISDIDLATVLGVGAVDWPRVRFSAFLDELAGGQGAALKWEDLAERVISLGLVSKNDHLVPWTTPLERDTCTFEQLMCLTASRRISSVPGAPWMDPVLAWLDREGLLGPLRDRVAALIDHGGGASGGGIERWLGEMFDVPVPEGLPVEGRRRGFKTWQELLTFGDRARSRGLGERLRIVADPEMVTMWSWRLSSVVR
ncbi:TfuA domain-containing protein [Rhizohabitans arisaemae]|uniref:TfuA domain-containing protein n=1 Tax=Rhizohabitans arisaemae TaxID=2720610 RepID=UPI0024B1E9C6|nr:TfuA domain-containing protein [Rhizohabitans arisaemae]